MGSLERYEEDYPFVFVSYSHKNEEIILSLIQSLHEKGINIWYDHDIIAREVWDDKIAGQIQSCRIVVCFITEDYLRSNHCVDELKYALNKGKAVLTLCVKGISFPSGLDMRLSSRQIVEVNNYPDIQYMTRRICECQEIQECMIPPAPAPDPTDEIQPLPSPESPDKEMLPEMKPVSLSRPGKANWLTVKKQLLIPLVLLISFALFLSGRSLFSASPETSLSISEQTIDWPYWNNLRRMKNLESISFRNCTFTSDISGSGTLSQTLWKFSADQCEGIEYLDMLAGQSGLTTLSITNCDAQKNDLYYFPSSLTSVDLSGNEQLHSLECLEKCKRLKRLDVSDAAVDSLFSVPMEELEQLNISRTKLVSLHSLREAVNLKILIGEECDIVSIEYLSKLEHLTEIDLSDCGIFLLDCEFLSLRLKRLDLSGNHINDINFLTNCTVLEDVDVSGNYITDVDILKKSAASLKKLNLSGNPISQENMTGLLKECSKLTELRIDGIPFSSSDDSSQWDLYPISHLTELQILSLSGCGIQNVIGITHLRNLEYLDLSDNHISEIMQFPSQYKSPDLNLMNNPCSSVVGISTTEFDKLILYAPEVQELNLPDSLKCEQLLVSGNVDAQELIQIAPNLFRIYIVAYPLDRRVALEDSVGINKLVWITPEEIPALLGEWNMQ